MTAAESGGYSVMCRRLCEVVRWIIWRWSSGCYRSSKYKSQLQNCNLMQHPRAYSEFAFGSKAEIGTWFGQCSAIRLKAELIQFCKFEAGTSAIGHMRDNFLNFNALIYFLKYCNRFMFKSVAGSHHSDCSSPQASIHLVPFSRISRSATRNIIRRIP